MITKEITLHRLEMNSLETVGYIEHDGLFLAFTLEPSKDNKKHPCIPFGTFNIMREYPSSKFGMVPALMKVPYRTGILIHSGNVASQSQGCILVGDDIENSPRGCHFITHSKVTLSMLRRYLNANSIDTIHVVDDTSIGLKEFYYK